MDNEFYESLRFKKGIKKVVKTLDFNFEIKATIDGLPNRNVTMIFTKDNSDNILDVTRFFNAIENTKRNIIKSINKILNESKEVILPTIESSDADIEMKNMFNPYHKDSRYVHIENIFFRVGSIWDQLAHICNVHYGLKIDIKRVSANVVFKQELANKITSMDNIVSKVESYFNEINGFYGFNTHDYVKDFRNNLAHYGDYNSLKFASDYMNSNIKIMPYPFGYILTVLIVDILKCFEFVKNMYDEYISKFADKK